MVLSQKEIYDELYTNGTYRGLYKDKSSIPYHYWMCAAYLYERRIIRPCTRTKVLDIGCGVGWFVETITYIGKAFVMGVDISEVAIQKSRVKGHLVCADISDQNLTLPFSKFDLVVSIGVFEHLPKECLPQALRNAFSLSRRGVFWIDQGAHDKNHHTNENPVWWANYIARATGLPAVVDYGMTEGGSKTYPILVNV